MRLECRLRSVDLDFLNTAPVRLVFAATVAAPPAAVHYALAQDTEGWTSWFDAVKRARPTRADSDEADRPATRHNRP